MGIPSTCPSRTKTARPLVSWPVTTVRTFIPCLFSSGLFMVTFLDSCNFVFIFNFPFHIRVGYSFGQNLTDVAYQLREARFAESLLNGVVRGVEDWTETSFHRAGHHASVMHLAAQGKNAGLAFDRLVDLTECYARCRAPEADAAVTALAQSDQSLPLQELEDLPHHDRVGLEAFRDCLRSRSLVAGVSDETHDVDGARHTTIRGHNITVLVTLKSVKVGRRV